MGNIPSIFVAKRYTPISRIPTEVIDQICECADPKSLKALSQTSRIFVSSSQRQLFHRLQLYAREYVIQDEEHLVCLQKTLAQSPDIKKYTRDVEISFDIEKQILMEKMYHILMGLANVEGLNVHVGNKSWAEFFPQTGTALLELMLLPLVKKLSLSAIRHIPADIFKTLMRIPIVEYSEVSFDIPEATFTDAWDVKTQSLTVCDFTFEGDEASVDSFLSQITDNNIKSVVISLFGSGKMGNVEAINKLLSSCSQLTTLECSLNEDDDCLEKINILPLKELTTVNINLSPSHDMTYWASSPYLLYPLECLLPGTKNPIEEINIRFDISSTKLWDQPVTRWETLDSLLSGTKYPRLKWIQFLVRGCDEGLSHVDVVHNDITSLLPKLNKKQLVQVEKYDDQLRVAMANSDTVW